jgi:hypothetical protein
MVSRVICCGLLLGVVALMVQGGDMAISMRSYVQDRIAELNLPGLR